MGDEIRSGRYHKHDYQRYRHHLLEEFSLLRTWFEQSAFAADEAMGGFEQEAWLVDSSMQAAPVNHSILQRANDPFLSPELAKFNIEFNVIPRLLSGGGLRQMHTELDERLRRCRTIAAEVNSQVVTIGILPTLRDNQLTLENMSAMNRYHALNEQVLRTREGVPLRLDIVGRQRLHSEHRDVMLEAATTSFQIHRQVSMDKSVRYYNAAIIASAPMVAISANSPYLFGADVWDETRIPIFEQAVAIGGYGDVRHGPLRRVSFGSGYAGHSLLECFIENMEHFPVLLPVEIDKPMELLPHLRLHNGTIWRWNRPLIGFDDKGVPHLRVEHRVIAAGPSVLDEMADAAFYFGLLESLATISPAPERMLEFAKAKDNFYRAAQHGLATNVEWLDGRRRPLDELIRHELVPLARQGLTKLQMRAGDIGDYLDVVVARVSSRRNGASWQRAFVQRHGADLQAMTQNYLQRQKSGLPVHEWSVEV